AEDADRDDRDHPDADDHDEHVLDKFAHDAARNAIDVFVAEAIHAYVLHPGGSPSGLTRHDAQLSSLRTERAARRKLRAYSRSPRSRASRSWVRPSTIDPIAAAASALLPNKRSVARSAGVSASRVESRNPGPAPRSSGSA